MADEKHGPPCLTLECLTCGMQAQIIDRAAWIERSFLLSPAHVDLVRAFQAIHEGHDVSECTTAITIDEPDEAEPPE